MNERIDTATTQRDIIPYTCQHKEISIIQKWWRGLCMSYLRCFYLVACRLSNMSWLYEEHDGSPLKSSNCLLTTAPGLTPSFFCSFFKCFFVRLFVLMSSVLVFFFVLFYLGVCCFVPFLFFPSFCVLCVQCFQFLWIDYFHCLSSFL